MERRLKGMVVLVVVAALVWPLGSASALSEICAAFDGQIAGIGSLSLTVSNLVQPAEAGEVLTVRAEHLTGENTMLLSVEVPVGTVVAGPASPPVTLKADLEGATSVRIVLAGNPGPTYRVTWSCEATDEADDEDEQAGPPCENVADGRINNDPGFDCAAPIAIYTGSLDIYAIDPTDGHGNLVLRLEDSVLSAPQDPAGGNVLLGSAINPYSGSPIDVYWLAATDEIQASTRYADGKAYIVAWPVGEPGALYHVSA